jgi:hypothetical protein
MKRCNTVVFSVARTCKCKDMEFSKGIADGI